MPSEHKSSDGDYADAKASSRSSRHDAKDADTLSAKADAKDRKEDDQSDSDLVSKVIAFFFDDDAFAQTFERFAETHCHVFDVASDEMKLEYTDIYNDFVALFDAKLEGSDVASSRRLIGSRTHARSLSIVWCRWLVSYHSVHCVARRDD